MQHPEQVIELCHVVDDMDSAIAYWIDVMAAGPFFVADMRFPEKQFYRGKPAVLDIQVAFAFAGNLLIELIKPAPGQPGVFNEVLERSGPGFHHVMLRGESDQLRARFEKLGYEIASDGWLPSGERCTLYDTVKQTGGFVEVMDLSPAVWGQFEKMKQAHDSWDRKADRVRPMSVLFA